MPFDLTLTMTGLTLFVPDGDRIFALLPATPPDMPHRAVLRVDPRYLAGGGTGGKWYEQDLDEWSLDLTPLAGRGGVVALPPGLGDAGAAAERRISRRQLGPNPDASVAARLTLPPATVMTRVHGGFWDLGPQMDVEMTHSVQWTLCDVQADTLQWGLFALNGFRAQPLPELRPVDGQIAVEVLHLPEDDVPKEPPCGTPAHHFGLYYSLFGKGANGPLPKFRAPPLVHPCDQLPQVVPGVAQGSFYTCMMAMSGAAGS